MSNKRYSRADLRRVVVGKKPKMSAAVPDRIQVYAAPVGRVRHIPTMTVSGFHSHLKPNECLVLRLDLERPKGEMIEAFRVVLDFLQREHRAGLERPPADIDLEIWRRHQVKKDTFPKIVASLAEQISDTAKDSDDLKRQAIRKFKTAKQFLDGPNGRVFRRTDWFKQRMKRPSGFLQL